MEFDSLENKWLKLNRGYTLKEEEVETKMVFYPLGNKYMAL
jgi:hypothetical protein